MSGSENSERPVSGIPEKASVRLNVARGLSSLVDQAMAKISARVPGVRAACDGLGEVLKAAIHEHPDIPKDDISAVDLARRAGLLKRKGRRG